MTRSHPRPVRARIAAAVLPALLAVLPVCHGAYVVNHVVGDMRQPPAVSGNTACPQRTRQHIAVPEAISRQWSTSLGTNPVTILTVDQTSAGRLNEIETVLRDSFAVWTGVSGSLLTPDRLATVTRTATMHACLADGVNSICLDQSDPAITTGVLAFTRVVVADSIGIRASASSPESSFIGEILDADIFLRPGDSSARFATPAALPANSSTYDLQSVITHEIGHLLGFGHSGVWPAMMFPFVPPPGTFHGSRPAPESPDAPLADDDRATVRALYTDSSDPTHVGSISGRIVPANPLALAGESVATTGVLGGHVVAVDAASGSVVAAAVSGWSCTDPGPPVFDGTYTIEGLPVGTGRDYLLYAAPMDGPASATDSLGSSVLCRNALTDPGWPAQFACIAPTTLMNFSKGNRTVP